MTLPETKVRLHLPAIRFENFVNAMTKGEGLIPHIQAPKTIEDIMKDRDPALEVVKRMVLKEG